MALKERTSRRRGPGAREPQLEIFRRPGGTTVTHPSAMKLLDPRSKEQNRYAERSCSSR